VRAYAASWPEMTDDWARWSDPDRFWPYVPAVAPVIDWDWVTDRVATGGGIWSEADVDRLHAAGITHVVTAADELVGRSDRLLSGDPRMQVLLNGLPDDGKWKPAWWFAKTVEFATDALRDPDAKIYLHCWSGKNRGPSHAYAVLRAQGWCAPEAERLIREARPKVILLYREDADEALAAMEARR
jgi:hypothetical protein